MNRSARRKVAAQQRRKARRDTKARRQRERRERYRRAIQLAADLFVKKVFGEESQLLNLVHLTPIDDL